ncbi:hypothetical protein [Hymenobacter sp. DG01]|uniref:hypothetical protein n=1 Tax=Hymenobacter sp. DG01 TaxID=2584940 RepID=UPI00112292D3|nr:hypothetical protein [Hymenobacter sp. DG01]
MQDNRKNAYRYLLYHFLIEIRTTPTPAQPWQRATEHIAYHSYYAGAVAYQLHNLALAAASDFLGFDEEQFWNGLESFSANNPALPLSHYRMIFDNRVKQLSC